jgi:hypothetical protein
VSVYGLKGPRLYTPLMVPAHFAREGIYFEGYLFVLYYFNCEVKGWWGGKRLFYFGFFIFCVNFLAALGRFLVFTVLAFFSPS